MLKARAQLVAESIDAMAAFKVLLKEIGTEVENLNEEGAGTIRSGGCDTTQDDRAVGSRGETAQWP